MEALHKQVSTYPCCVQLCASVEFVITVLLFFQDLIVCLITCEISTLFYYRELDMFLRSFT
jgi:hypothetical protein